MKNTPEQMAFFREVEFGTSNILLESVAGSGKTTSIVQCLNYIDDAEPIVACSFTKLAAQQLEKKILAQDFKNVQSTTLNALGWRVCRQNVKGCQIDANKTVNILKYQLQYSPLPDGIQAKELYEKMKGPVKRLIGLLKSYVVRPENAYAEAERLADYHGVDTPEGTTTAAEYARKELFQWVVSVYRYSIECTSMMDFDDQKFFPVWFRWSMPKFKKIIIDECQDCNVCDIEMVKLLQNGSANSRTFWVGDRKQAIYLFRGSLLNAMDIIRKDFNCTYLTLSVCWRCADDILIEAKELNPLIKSPESNPKGKGIVGHVTTADFLARVSVGDFVICRTTAPLVKRCLQLIKANKPAKVKGREIGKGLVNLIEKIAPDISMDLKEFVEKIGSYKTERVGLLEAAGREDAAIKIQDECEAIEHFCMDATSIAEVVSKIDSLFTDDDDETSYILLLTGHKSKGLENDKVWFLRPDLCPFPKASSPHEKEAEMNLRYVILTRAALERWHVQPEKDEVKPGR